MTRREDNAPGGGGGGGVRWSARGPARALLRAGYATVRLPLRTVAEVALSQLDGRAPLRVAYSELLITVDEAAARHLGDGAAGVRAAHLAERVAATKVHIANVAATNRLIAAQRIAEGPARMARYRQYRSTFATRDL